jgi:mono/diheme cytochrome c family protein
VDETTMTPASSKRPSNSISSQLRVLLAAVLLLACAGSPVLAEADDVAALWAKHCASCHGEDGTADTKAGKMLKVLDLTAADVRADFDRAAMITVTSEGVKNEKGKTVMKGYASKLEPSEIESLVDYIFALVPEAAAEAEAGEAVDEAPEPPTEAPAGE